MPSSRNKAGTSGSRAVRVVRGQVGKRVASKRETQVTVHGALRSVSEVSFFWASSEVQVRAGVRCELVGRARWQPTNTTQSTRTESLFAVLIGFQQCYLLVSQRNIHAVHVIKSCHVEAGWRRRCRQIQTRFRTGLNPWQSARAQDSTETHVFGAILMMCSDVQRHV